MKILIANNTVIPAKDYGGTERVIWWLGRELVRLGHKVTYLVAAGSSCPFADVIIRDDNKGLHEQVPPDTDIVHMHYQTEEKITKPCLFTHHGNYHDQDTFHINTVFVSRNHAQRNSADAYVYNGIDTEEYGPVDLNAPRQHLLFLGYAKRPEKNLKDCSALARQSGNKLAVVGGKFRWFKWRPWLEYKGFLSGEAKNRVIQQSRALVYPVRWHEPFGLAVVEALYFGCPVVATPYGSLPELVKPDVGFLSNSRTQLLAALKTLDKFEPRRCHEYVCDRFTSRHMAQNYLTLYAKILNGQALNAHPPQNGGNYFWGDLLPMTP